MKSTCHILKWILVGFVALYGASAVSGPRVVVSVPPLHSLVSMLMDGAGQPVLLSDTTSGDAALQPDGVLALIAADMFIWVGPGYETSINSEIINTTPATMQSAVTLSNHVPLFVKQGIDVQQDDLSGNRQGTRDLEFWEDPKLAIMAVRYITPRLVRLDPDNQELYLDNEIQLIEKLKSLQTDLAAVLSPFTEGDILSTPESGRYFAHRFGSSGLPSDVAKRGLRLADSRCTSGGLRKVSVNNNEVAAVTRVPVAGQETYFTMMRDKAGRVLETACSMPARDNV